MAENKFKKHISNIIYSFFVLKFFNNQSIKGRVVLAYEHNIERGINSKTSFPTKVTVQKLL